MNPPKIAYVCRTCNSFLERMVLDMPKLADRPCFMCFRIGELSPILKTWDRVTRIVGLIGPPGSGKDTAADVLTRFGMARLAFANPVREVAMAINPIISSRLVGDRVRLNDLVQDHGWDYVKRQFPEVRRLLRTIGDEGGRKIHGEDCWLNIVKRTFQSLDSTRVVFTDIRYPNEHEFVTGLGGNILKIHNPRLMPDDSGHRSESFDLPHHVTIHNDDSIEKLYRRVANAILV